MKIRTDFVTNSSSSSFIIAKKDLTENQIRAIRQHSTLAIKLGLYEWAEPGDTDLGDEQWNISENENFITGFTWCDNFDMEDLFNKIGVSRDSVKWQEMPFYLANEEFSEKEEDWEAMLDAE